MAGLVKAIAARLGRPVLLPEQPQYVRALGAAALPARWSGKEVRHADHGYRRRFAQ